MQALMLNYEFPPIGGGAGNATYHISRGLVRAGCRVDVLTSIYDGQQPVEHVDGVRVYRVTSWRKDIFDCGVTGAWSYLLFARFQLAKLLNENKYDIVHIFFSLPTGILTVADKRMMRLPYVVSLRGSDVPGYDKYNKTLQHLHRILMPVNRYVLKNASRVVALSKGLREIALEACPEISIDVIYNGVESALFQPCRDNPATEDVRLITVSRLINRKGIQHLLEALSRLRNEKLSLKIVGTGNYEGQLRRIAKSLKVDDRVEFCGYKMKSELPNLYSNSDIFVLPSLTESFGQVFAEAMACGLPIIGSNIGGIPEVVTHHENGILVEPGNVESLRSALLLLIRDERLRKAMSEKNLMKIKESFDWDAISTQYLDIYSECCRANN